MTPEQLADAIRAALADLVAAGELSVEIPARLRVERPRQAGHGDWSSNIAMQLAKPAGMAPRELAGVLAARLEQEPGIAAVEVAGPGFLNLTLDTASAGELARTIVAEGPAYGINDSEGGRRTNVEFVSANPTGPIHLGGTRWAAVGDALARILQANGGVVSREYYFNDHGAQIDRFSRSLLAVARGLPAPEDGYAGAYIGETAAVVIAADPEVLQLPDEQAQEVFRARGVDMMFAEIQTTLRDFGVEFDVFFHENDLHASGAVDTAIERLRQLRSVYEQDGALWVRTSEFGDDKDRVVVRSNGKPSYYASDLAYYLDKRTRGFDRVFILLGADHHGYVGRLMAMAEAFGDVPHENLEVMIGQMVNLVKDGQPVRMSKRAGTLVVLEDLVDTVGVDAARYALTRSSTDSTIDIDLDLLASRTNDNPVFYVQYAHARTANVARLAAQDGVHREGGFNPSLLADPTEAALLATLADYPRVVHQSAVLREPHRVARYLEDLAGRYHKWYDTCRVRPMNADEPVTDVHRTRLWLNDAARIVLANGLALLGVSAPDRM